MPKQVRREALSVNGPAGHLEVLVEYPAAVAADTPVLVIAHPHPAHGGAMTNKVVHTLARAANLVGATAVRFNFRGVGASEGQYDEGRGELEDLMAIAQWAREKWPEAALRLSGFSFGAAMCVLAAEQLAPESLTLVAPPIGRILSADAVVPAGVPLFVVQGAQDDVVDPDLVIEWANGQPPGVRLSVIDEADHFFHGQLVVLREALVAEMSSMEAASS